MSRYDRQIILPQIGQAGQQKIAAAHILMVGAGGLGVPALQYLVAAGIGRITLIDPDHVSETNLHRQPIYGGQIGRSKVEAAAEFARNLNPDVRVTPIADWLTPSNATELVENADLVLDCADSFGVSYVLSDVCFAMGKPLISASALGLSGYVGGFCGGAPSLRAIFPDLPETVASCATAGVMGPVVGILGGVQAQMALTHILGLAPSPLGLCINYEWARFHSSSFRFDHAPEPDYAHAFVAVKDVRPTDLVIDLRGLDEAPESVTPDALRLGVGELSASAITERAPERVVFVCRTGLRAWRAADILHQDWDGEIRLLAIQQ